MVNPCFLIWIDMYIKKPQNTYFPPPIALTVNCESLPESQSHIEYSENGLYQLESFHIPNLLLKPLLVQSEYTFSKISWPQVVYVNVLIQLASLYAELTHKRNIYIILFSVHITEPKCTPYLRFNARCLKSHTFTKINTKLKFHVGL